MSTYPIGGRSYEFGIADRIRVVREQSGLDQDQLAERTGISRSTISNYERGQTKPRRTQIIAIALATGFHPEWLETGIVSAGPDGEGNSATGEYARSTEKVVAFVKRQRDRETGLTLVLPLRKVIPAAAAA